MEWRDAFEDHILSEVPGTTINGDRVRRLPNVTNISFDGIESEAALMLLDQHGICCSAGSACTSGSVNPSHVLKAMGLSNERARASLRFSFGRLNSAADIQQVCSILPGVVEKLRSLSPAGSPVLAA
jgi:cysteine desulfurase